MEKYFRVASTISRWKIDSALEKFLAYIADDSEIGKRLYILYYSFFDRTYHKNSRKYIKKEAERQRQHCKDFSDISESALTRDMEYCLHRYGVSFEEYFIYRFYDLNKYGRRKFNSLKMQYGYCEQFNSPSIAKICEDKYETYKLFKKHYKRDLILYDNPGKSKDELLSFARKYKKMIFKPLCGHSGQGIQLLQSDTLNSEILTSVMSH